MLAKLGDSQEAQRQGGEGGILWKPSATRHGKPLTTQIGSAPPRGAAQRLNGQQNSDTGGLNVKRKKEKKKGKDS